jgi:hypothetical protein
MLKCNQNGITGKLEKRIKNYSTKVDIWRTPDKNPGDNGWIGIFNRNEYLDIVKFDKEELGLKKGASYNLFNIWDKSLIKDGETFYFEIPGNDVVFIHYKSK